MHVDVGRRCEQVVTHGVLARYVDAADPVPRALLLDAADGGAERTPHHVAAGVRGVDRSGEQRIEIKPAHATPCSSTSTSSAVPPATIVRRASGSEVTSARPPASRTTAPASLQTSRPPR